MKRKGFSLIDLILAIGIIALLFGGIFMVYFSIVDTAINFELRRAASSILAQRVELVRSLTYEQVGVVGGIPAGILLQSEQVDWDGKIFVVSASVRNIDDPFDGTATSTPIDTAPGDYKLVEFDVACPTCAHFTPVAITTTVAPRGLESASQNGSLFIAVFDADGHPVPDATVSIINASTTPAINFTDVTDTNGRLQLVDVPTSTQAYAISVSKAGYSTEMTYPQNGVGNPNPIKPHATVSSQTVTSLSFAIDRLASVPIRSVDTLCRVVPNAPFTIKGSKLIGTSPSVYKYSYTGTTGVGGITTQNLEWDTYDFTYTGTSDLVGTNPYEPYGVAPSSTQPFAFILAPTQHPALQVVTLDAASGQPLEATITLNGPSYNGVVSTSLATYAESDWSGNAYTTATGVDVGSEITLAPPGGPYAASGFLESQTIDFGGTPAGAQSISWNGSTGGGTTLRFQVAGSDTGSDWTYVGPDGSSSSYFASPGELPGNVSGKRYLRYKAYLGTIDTALTPTLSSISFEYRGPCVPPGQRLFSGIPTGNYTISAQAPGHASKNANITVGAGWQQVILMLDPS